MSRETARVEVEPVHIVALQNLTDHGESEAFTEIRAVGADAVILAGHSRRAVRISREPLGMIAKQILARLAEIHPGNRPHSGGVQLLGYFLQQVASVQ